MNKILKYDNFINEGFLRKVLNIEKGPVKLIFDKYYGIYSFDEYSDEEEFDSYDIQPISYLDYLIIITEKIQSVNYNTTNDFNIKNNCIFINDREIKLDNVTYKYNDKFEEDDKYNYVYRLRSKEDAIKTYKELYNKINLDDFIMNDNNISASFKKELVDFISINIKDISYILNANNFDLI